MKRIMVTGLCTLHWGRLQYGNIGNYYIVEPLFRLLHRWFPEYEIVTTFQMDDGFISRENITVLPMGLYYEWNENDLINARNDVIAAERILEGCDCSTPYIAEIQKCEYIINVSGDMWGDNAEHVGHNRLLVDCLKMKAAQLLKKKTILYAVTPGPFTGDERLLAKSVFEKFDLVVIREKVSRNNLIQWGFSVDNVVWAPCPSYLFEANENFSSKWIDKIRSVHFEGRRVIGLTFGGFNMPVGPYDMWPREDWQYDVFVKVVEYIINELNSDVVLFSHTNGFDLPPEFRLISGRDYLILKQLYDICCQKLKQKKERIIIINEPLLPNNLKKVIGDMDMLVTGRVHASVAATSQFVPTVYIEYDRRVIYSDKMTGFSSQIGMEKYVCEPGNYEKIRDSIRECYLNIDEVKVALKHSIDVIKKEANNIFGRIQLL